MKKLIDKAFTNYANLPPLEQAKIKTAWGGIGLFFLYLLYEGITDGWRTALGIFGCVFIFVTVVAVVCWVAQGLKKIIGEKAANIVAAGLVLAFIGLVLGFITSNWGR
ncbi:MAG: hypothetical protein KKA05_03050 [Alphaproteobacteria bacterium]|nr:hypothetical protein [Alphaproteobacteria bacterium]MBU0859969.1 hypothetical protein [Alphaproteobacteria bacterium]